MPERRAPIRARSCKITAAAVEAYAVAVRTEPTYLGCIRGEPCLSPRANVHCASCAAHLEACRVLGRELHISPSGILPIDAAADEPPADWRVSAAAWVDARQLRAELEAALEKEGWK